MLKGKNELLVYVTLHKKNRVPNQLFLNKFDLPLAKLERKLCGAVSENISGV